MDTMIRNITQLETVNTKDACSTKINGIFMGWPSSEYQVKYILRNMNLSGIIFCCVKRIHNLLFCRKCLLCFCWAVFTKAGILGIYVRMVYYIITVYKYNIDTRGSTHMEKNSIRITALTLSLQGTRCRV